MLGHYVMRKVEPGALTSSRRGITYLDEVYSDPERAERRAETYNRFASVAGISYFVLPHDDNEPLPADYFEPRRVTYERVEFADL